MKNVVIIGTGGHAKVVADIVLSARDHLIGFLTSDDGLDHFMGWPILGKDTEYDRFMDCYFVIAIGRPDVRERISNAMNGVKWYSAIHPSAVLSTIHTSIGDGTVIMANAVINPYARIGSHCIINSSATVEHDNEIEDFVHISVGAELAGTVKIGKRTWVGVGAAIKNGICVCRDCVIGAGAVVVKNIDIPGTYVGIPARKVES